MLTSSEIKNKFGCKVSKCYSCKKRKECKEKNAKEYRKYIVNQNRFLNNNSKFYCGLIKGRCQRTDCEFYSICIMEAKKNLDKWVSAHAKNMKEELEKLSKGEL